MELHLGSLSRKIVAATNGAKLWEKLHNLIIKQRKDIDKVCEDLGKLAPDTVGPLQSYLINDKVEDMLEKVYYDLLREGTPLSGEEQHQLKDFWGLNEAQVTATDNSPEGRIRQAIGLIRESKGEQAIDQLEMALEELEED
jgi:hypothetical protein